MRKYIAIIMILFLGAVVLPAVSKADSVTTVLTYAAGTSNTSFSAPGKSITFNFSLPTTLPSLDLIFVPISVSFGGHNYSEAGTVELFSAASGGLFDVFFIAGFNLYEWDLFGGQIFNAQNHLVDGLYPVDPTKSGYSIDFNDFGTFSSGSVQVGAVPEPTSLLLLGVGLLGLVPAARKRFGSKKSVEN